MNAFVPIIPNAFAVVFWLIAPSITADVVERLKGKIQAHLTADKQAAAPTNALSINQMDNYVPWASDLVQVPPAGLLPVAGAVIGLVGDLNGVVAVIIIFASVIATFLCYFWVASKDPSIYTNKKYYRYNAVPAFAISINFLSGVAMLAVSLNAFEYLSQLVGRMV